MTYNFTSSPETQSDASSGLQPLQDHPDYIAGMANINAGRWQQAIKSFQMLQETHPDNAEVKKLLDEVEMRATMSQVKSRSGSRDRKGGGRLIISILLLLVIAGGGYAAYELWIDPVLLHEFRVRQVTDLRNQIDEAIASGDYVLARQGLQQLKEILPDDLETNATLSQIGQMEKLSTLYGEAKTLMADNKWEQALETLTELQRLDAQYRDLPQLVQVAQEAQALNEQFQTAEDAFMASEWLAAITQYEKLQQTDLTFRFDDIQTRLFESYLNQGQALLQEAGTDAHQVSEALIYFSNALKLRPVDTTALDARRLAETYLAALEAVDQDEKIDLLQIIYAKQPDYAGQQVAELLYTTLLERATAFLEINDEAAAIIDYQAAVDLAVADTSEAQHKLAELTAQTAP